MQIHKVLVLLALNVFSCLGQEIFNYVGTCWRFVNYPHIKFPIYLRPPFDELLQKLNLRRTISVLTRPQESLLGQGVHEIEKITPPCFSNLLDIFIPGSANTDKIKRKLLLEIFWIGSNREIERVTAFVPADFGEDVTEMFGVKGLAMIPVNFVKNDVKMGERRSRITAPSESSGTVQKEMTLIKYELILQHPSGFRTTHIFADSSELSDNPRNFYYLLVETFNDDKLTEMVREQIFICDVTETKVDSVEVSSSKVSFFVDQATSSVSLKLFDINGNLLNHLKFFKENEKFQLRSDRPNPQWDIFRIKSQELNSDTLARHGPFCLHHVVEKLKKKCTFSQKELTLTEYRHGQLTLYQRSIVVPTVESSHVIRQSRPAYRDEIKECREKK